MKVFISWSGKKSKAVAKVLRRRLPNILQAVDPYMSDQDIDKGDRWFQNLSEELNNALFGIVCLTPSNLGSEWISFEAGAIASKLDQSRITALLIGLKKSNVSGPLAQFQLTEITESDFSQLMSSINNQLGDKGLSEVRLNDQLEVFWPKVKEEIDQAISEAEQNLSEKEIERSEKDLLEEILELARQNARRLDRFEKPIIGMPGSSPGDAYVDLSEDKSDRTTDQVLRTILDLPENVGEIAERSDLVQLGEMERSVISIRENENPLMLLLLKELDGEDLDAIENAALTIARAIRHT